MTSLAPQTWPELPYAALRPTADTLQLWMQIVGKVRLARTPWLNHGWHAVFYVSARGFTTSLIPDPRTSLELEFDLRAHVLAVRSSEGGERRVPLAAGSIAAFYAEVMEALAALGAPTRIVATPNELPDATPFAEDLASRPYDSAMATDFWRALIQVDRVFHRFRTRFLGKCSPVHLFWGGADLAVTRFSGRRAPLHPGGIPHLPDAVTREAYSHEVSSAGFWPGDNAKDGPCFYSYAYPTPDGFSGARVAPEAARFDERLGEFLLPYEAVRTAADPDAALLAFLQSAYEAAADAAGWDRDALECEEGAIGHPRLIVG
ncbi:DUF5996 family protein [Phenylobacterium sp. LjRoot225]|uniref:DUF5996 family protein n=1 Tax=Phenylobacterium sp. LjRoot225 TaxID=3342285 RepID=UPI003ECC3BFD